MVAEPGALFEQFVRTSTIAFEVRSTKAPGEASPQAGPPCTMSNRRLSFTDRPRSRMAVKFDRLEQNEFRAMITEPLRDGAEPGRAPGS